MAHKDANDEALKKVEDQLDCAICLQPYTDPKLLLCFHVYCKHCLEQIIIRNQDGSTVTCPKCRRLTPLPPSGVAGLQSAFHINHLFDIRDTLQKAKESQKTQCEKCTEGTATGFCHECGKFICEKCIKAHQLFEEVHDHQVFSRSEIQKDAYTLVPPKKKVLYCSKHAKQELKIYCDTCKVLICIDCTIRIHQGHQYDLVTDTFPKYRDEIQAHLQPVKQQLEMVNKSLQALDTRTKEIGDQRMAIEGEIHKNIDKIHQVLERRRAELIGQLDQITQLKLKNLAAQKDQTEMLQAQLTSCLEYVEGSLTTSTPAELLAMKEPVTEQIRGIVTNLSPEQLGPKEEASTNLVAIDLESECHKYGQVLPGNPEVDPTQCQVTGDKLNVATVGEKGSVILHTVDKRGKVFSVPTTDISVELVHCTDQTVTQCEVKKGKEKGEYTLLYTPTTRGRHELHIKIGQTPIGCSPLPVVAKLPPNRLGNPVRTIANVTSYEVVVNSKGHILLSEIGKSRLSVLSSNGQVIRTFGNVRTPWGICFDSNCNVLVAGHNDHKIHQFTPNGDHLQSIGGEGSNPLQFYHPIGIAYSNKSQKIYISEYSNHRVQILNEDLSYSASFGTQGSGSGQLNNPRGVAVDSSGNVHIADERNNSIQVFSPEGRFLRRIGNKGSNPGQLCSPYGIHIDEDDTVYIAEGGNKRVSVFTSQGQFLTCFGQGQFSDPYGLTVDEDGFVIVIDGGKNRLVIF